MILTYEYRLLPSRRQHRALETLLEAQRLLYNAALEERIGAYRHGVVLSLLDQQKGLTQWRKSDSEAASVALNIQRATLKRLDEAYKGFFRRLRSGASPGFPRFKGTGRWNSFGFRVCWNSLRWWMHRFKGLPGRLRLHVHRLLPNGSRICSCTFRRNTKGWKVGFDVEIQPEAPRRGNRVVGVDLGISTFAALSDGGFIPSLRAARRAQRRLRQAQRCLARKARGSQGRKKAKARLARCHSSIHRARSNHLHAASARLIRDYDAVALERINVLGLASSALARDVLDASWAKFTSLLRYKAERAGVRLVEVDARSTSQECCCCGKAVPKALSERWHACPHCGLVMDRDLNAARNILGRAGVGPCLRNVAGGGMRAGGNLDWVESGSTPAD